jgi:hypothetical protein
MSVKLSKLYMIKLLFLPLLLISCLSFAQAPKDIIGKPYRIGSLEIAQFDFSKAMYWDQANNVCKGLGKGWRLPTKNELKILYRNKAKIIIGGHSYNFYWGDNEDKDYPSMRQNFSDGEQELMYEDDRCRVRAVRTVMN